MSDGSGETERMLAAAMEHHRAGRWREAEAGYRQLLSNDPGNARALHLLGLIAHYTGHHREAEELIRQSLAIEDRNCDGQNDIGLVLLALGRPQEAMSHFARSMHLAPPGLAQPTNNYGAALEQCGRIEEASAAYRRAVEIWPDYPEALSNLGRMWAKAGDSDQAIALWRRAVALAPGQVQPHIQLADALRLVDAQQAIAHGREAVKLAPQNADAHLVLAAALTIIGQMTEALDEFRAALALEPNHVHAMVDVAWALEELGRHDEALPHLQRALELRPNDPEVLSRLANSLLNRQQHDQAIDLWKRALVIQPNQYIYHNNIGSALYERGDICEACDSFALAIEAKPDHAAVHSNLLLTSHYLTDMTPQQMFEAHQKYQQKHERPVIAAGIKPHDNDRDPDRPIRIGYVSAHFRRHAIFVFLEPLLRAHNRSQFIVTCYSTSRDYDEHTERLKREAVNDFHYLVGLDDDYAADLIRSHKQDLLIDIEGHIEGNRLPIFMRRPAPVQLTYLGYQDTTGLQAMDYRITDAVADPPGQTDPFYTEKLLRLPCFFCYQPMAEAPEVTALPAKSRGGRITFGSFNNPAKYNADAIALWSELLRQVPESRLLLLVNAPGESERRLQRLFEANHIPADRYEFRARLGPDDYMHFYDEIDIALDPFPFSGHTTTCDALWMGAPVVTLAGKTYAGRMSTSTLFHAGLPQWVAQDKAQYLAIASELANDVDRLAEIRRTLRDQVAASRIIDGQRFTREFEQACRDVWRAWCATPA